MTGQLGGEPLGKVTESCPCCDLKFQVVNNSGVNNFDIRASFSQCSVCCRTDCGCYEATFDILKAKDTPGSKPVGSILKRFGGLGGMIPKAGYYEINFPEDANVEEKLLIIGATIMLDHRYYESGKCR
jgi:hypothetical protein